MEVPQIAYRRPAAGKLSLREVTEQALLQHIAPPAASVNGRGDIFLSPWPTANFELPPGETGSYNIVNMLGKGCSWQLCHRPA